MCNHKHFKILIFLTFTQSDGSQHQYDHSQSETSSSHPEVCVCSLHSVAVGQSLSWAVSTCSVCCVNSYSICSQFYTDQEKRGRPRAPCWDSPCLTFICLRGFYLTFMSRPFWVCLYSAYFTSLNKTFTCEPSIQLVKWGTIYKRGFPVNNTELVWLWPKLQYFLLSAHMSQL